MGREVLNNIKEYISMLMLKLVLHLHADDQVFLSCTGTWEKKYAPKCSNLWIQNRKWNSSKFTFLKIKPVKN